MTEKLLKIFSLEMTEFDLIKLVESSYYHTVVSTGRLPFESKVLSQKF